MTFEIHAYNTWRQILTAEERLDNESRLKRHFTEIFYDFSCSRFLRKCVYLAQTKYHQISGVCLINIALHDSVRGLKEAYRNINVPTNKRIVSVRNALRLKYI